MPLPHLIVLPLTQLADTAGLTTEQREVVNVYLDWKAALPYAPTAGDELRLQIEHWAHQIFHDVLPEEQVYQQPEWRDLDVYLFKVPQDDPDALKVRGVYGNLAPFGMLPLKQSRRPSLGLWFTEGCESRVTPTFVHELGHYLRLISAPSDWTTRNDFIESVFQEGLSERLVQEHFGLNDVLYHAPPATPDERRAFGGLLHQYLRVMQLQCLARQFEGTDYDWYSRTYHDLPLPSQADFEERHYVIGYEVVAHLLQSGKLRFSDLLRWDTAAFALAAEHYLARS